MGTPRNLCCNESGTTALEYALLAALIAMAIIFALMMLSTNVSELFDSVAKHVSGP